MKRKFTLTVLLLLIFSAAYVFAGETQQSVKTFKVLKGGLLKISLASGDIRINSWDKNEVSIRMDDMDDADSHSVKISQSGNNIVIESRGSGWHNSNDVSVAVPKEFNLALKTNQGNVDIRSDITGTVTVFSGGGDITVKNISGKTSLNSNGGDINTNDLTGDADISTKGGDITTGNIYGNGDLNTLGGSIVTENVSKNLIASTNGGEIQTGNIGGKLDAKTLGGEIDIKKVSLGVSVKTNGGNIKLAGSNGPVIAKTLGGNIDLNSVSGPVDAITYSGDVYVELESAGNSSSSISTMSGWISLYLNSSEKATIQAKAVNSSDGGQRKAITSDFNPKSYKQGDYSGVSSATYILNEGGPEISLKTMNGGIKIKKLR